MFHPRSPSCRRQVLANEEKRDAVGGDKDGDGVCDPETGGPVVPAPTGTGCISDVGAASSWTAIIVNMLKVTAGATLVLNSNYSASTVPVPDGIGPNSTRTLLVN